MTGKIFFRISVVALFTVGAIAHAMALSFKDISGKWCSKDGDSNFRPDMLIAKFHDRTPTRRLKVSSYDYSADKITMYWSRKGQKLYTEFSEFSPNGRAMTQLEDASENPTVRSRRELIPARRSSR
jgi:hypothetical protein